MFSKNLKLQNSCNKASHTEWGQNRWNFMRVTTINLETRECLDTYSLQRARITSGNTAKRAGVHSEDQYFWHDGGKSISGFTQRMCFDFSRSNKQRSSAWTKVGFSAEDGSN